MRIRTPGPAGAKRLPLAFLALLQTAWCGPPPALAQLSPNGPAFQVNTYTTQVQYSPAVAVDAAGDFVVVWASYGSSGGDISLSSIQAQRFSARGTALAAQFQVNNYITQAQRQPAVAMDAVGNFVVAWRSYASPGSDQSGSSVQARRFAASGAPLGVQFQVNTYTTSYQDVPAVASDALGNFVVVWESNGSAGADHDHLSVQGQRYAVSGAPQGAQFQVNTYTTGYQFRATISADGLGNFIVGWHSTGSSGGDTQLFSVQVQRYAGNGSAMGAQFQANTYITSSQVAPAVAADSAGNFLVAWQSYGSDGGDNDQSSLQVRRFAANGTAQGSEFQVNSYATSFQKYGAIAADARGNFVVAWQSAGSSAGDTSSDSIQARRYLANGTALEGQFQVNTYTTNFQRYPVVASDPLGNFVVVWESNGAASGDTSYSSIWARRYDGLFRDGFDTGGTVRWSSSVP